MSARLVHVVDDDDAVRDSVGFLLESAGYQVKTYESGVEFLAAFKGDETGVLVTDVRMPELTGLEMANRLKRLGSKLPIVVMTGHADVPLAVQAMKAGAKDFIEKPFERDTLLRAVKNALATAELPQAAIDGGARDDVLTRMHTLSAREQQILMGLIAGKANKAMARELGISPRTVEVYRGAVMTKMQASSLSQLVRMAVLAAQVPSGTYRHSGVCLETAQAGTGCCVIEVNQQRLRNAGSHARNPDSRRRRRAGAGGFDFRLRGRRLLRARLRRRRKPFERT